MKPLNSLAIVVGLLLVGAGWLHFIHDPRVRSAAAAQAGVDSLRARGDSIARVDSLARIQFADSLARVHRADSTRAAALARRASLASARGDSLERAIAAAPDSMIPKPQVLAALAAKDSVIAVAEARRLQDSTAAAHDRAIFLGRQRTDSLTIGGLRGDLKDSNDRLAKETGSRRGNLHLVAGVGYAMTETGGIVRAGPSLFAGLGYTLF